MMQKQKDNAARAFLQAQLDALLASISEKEAQLHPIQARHLHLQVSSYWPSTVPVAYSVYSKSAQIVQS